MAMIVLGILASTWIFCLLIFLIIRYSLAPYTYTLKANNLLHSSSFYPVYERVFLPFVKFIWADEFGVIAPYPIDVINTGNENEDIGHEYLATGRIEYVEATDPFIIMIRLDSGRLMKFGVDDSTKYLANQLVLIDQNWETYSSEYVESLIDRELLSNINIGSQATVIWVSDEIYTRKNINMEQGMEIARTLWNMGYHDQI